jgi:hypothetical protein
MPKLTNEKSTDLGKLLTHKWAIWNDEMDSLAKADWSFTREAPPCSSKLV